MNTEPIRSDSMMTSEHKDCSDGDSMISDNGVMINHVQSISDQMSIHSGKELDTEKRRQLVDHVLNEALDQTTGMKQNQRQTQDQKKAEMDCLYNELDRRRHEVAEIELRTELFGQTTDLSLNNMTEMQREVGSTDSVLSDITKATQNADQATRNANDCAKLLTTNSQYFDEEQEKMEMEMVQFIDQFDMEWSMLEKEVDDCVAKLAANREHLEAETSEFDREIESLRSEVELKEKENEKADIELATERQKLEALTSEKEKLEKEYISLREQRNTQSAQNDQLEEEMKHFEQAYEELTEENETKKNELKVLMSETEVAIRRLEELKEKCKNQHKHQTEENKNQLDNIRNQGLKRSEQPKQEKKVHRQGQPISTQVEPLVRSVDTKVQTSFTAVKAIPAPPPKPSAGIRRLMRPMQPGDRKFGSPGSESSFSLM